MGRGDVWLTPATVHTGPCLHPQAGLQCFLSVPAGTARDRAFPDWEADLDEPDVDTIRDGILECITDDILCAMPEGYETGIDAATGAPTLTWVGCRAGG